MPWMKIVAAAAVGAGVGYIVCKLANSLRGLLSVTSLIKEIALITASATAVKVLIEWLKGGTIRSIPIVNRYAIVLTFALILLHRALEAIESVIEDWDFLNELTDNIDEVCTYSKELVYEAAAKGKENSLSVADRLHFGQ